MAWIDWAPNNSDPQLIREIRGTLAPRITEIEEHMRPGKCCVCGQIGQLTEEHTPSKKAHNSARGHIVTIDDASAIARQLIWKSERIQGGARQKSLCAECNNQTGRRYTPAYLDFVRACEPHANPTNAGVQTSFTVRMYPARVAKQALTTLSATCQSGLLEVYQEIRRLILDPSATGSLNGFRLHLYLVANKGTIRMTGIAATADLTTKQGRLLAEFSAWPLGWVLMLDDQPVQGATDVSSWFQYGYHEEWSGSLATPCQWAVAPRPLDFRNTTR